MDKTYNKILNLAIDKRTTIPLIKGAFFKEGYVCTTDLNVFVRVKNEGAKPNEDAPEIPKLGKLDYRPLQDIDKIIAALDAVSTDQTRPALCGVDVRDHHIAATDGYAMYLAPTSIDVEMWIPSKVVKMLKVGKKLSWEFSANDDSICFRTGDLEILTENTHPQFPAVEQLINKKPFAHRFTFDVEELKEAIKLHSADHFAIMESGEVKLLRWNGWRQPEIERVATIKTKLSHGEQKEPTVHRIVMPMSREAKGEYFTYAWAVVRRLLPKKGKASMVWGDLPLNTGNRNLTEIRIEGEE